MVCYLRCSIINEDIRLRKYVNACEVKNVPFLALTWDRLAKNVGSSNEVQFKKTALYGGKWKNLLSKIQWQFFLLKNLYIHRKRYNVIHSVDIDTIMPALLFKYLFGKKVVFDIYDSLSAGIKNSTISDLILFLERSASYSSDCLILPDKERFSQLELSEQKLRAFLEVENVPHLDNNVTGSKRKEAVGQIVLSYVGVFDHDRGLDDVLELVKENDRYVLNIAGTGALQQLVEEASASCERIVYHGQVKYENGLQIMKDSDVIIGMYYKRNSNHIYAAPNKYYESLFLAKPLITTSGTLVGNKVLKNDTGYPLDEGTAPLLDCLKSINVDDTDYQRKSGNAQSLWDTVYCNYFQQRITTEYLSIIFDLYER